MQGKVHHFFYCSILNEKVKSIKIKNPSIKKKHFVEFGGNSLSVVIRYHFYGLTILGQQSNGHDKSSDMSIWELVAAPKQTNNPGLETVWLSAHVQSFIKQLCV